MILTLYASLSFGQAALDTVCIFDPPSRLAVPYQPGMKYQWSVGQGRIQGRTDSNVVSIDWSNANAGFYQVAVFAISETNFCPGDTSYGYIRVTAPNLARGKFPTIACKGDIVILESTISGDHVWVGGSTDQSISFTAKSDTSIFLIALNEACENDTVAFDIQVYDQPEARIGFLPDTLYFGDSQALFFQGDPAGDASIEWYLNRVYEDEGARMEVEFLQFGENEIWQIVSNGYCADTAVRYVYIDELFKAFFPNAFTPNGDGLNDIWKFKGVGHTGYLAQIYNRWGELVYQWDHNSTFPGWDGTNSGQKSPQGTYLYKVEIKDQRGEMHYYTNYFSLIR